MQTSLMQLAQLVACTLVLLSSHTLARPSVSPVRPALVEEALKNGDALYYFGLGSNMLRSKLEGRGTNGTKIDILSIEPAVVPGHRLSFNLRAYPPLEPGFGSLEPSDSGCIPLRSYAKNECHGALVLLTPENYERVMASEGSPGTSPNAGYEEIVVDAFPYNSNRLVKAVSLRARSHVRLRRDPRPSQRYMAMLIEGAAELGIRPCYQQFLADHPTQQTSEWLRVLALNNWVFFFTLSSFLKSRIFSYTLSRLLFLVYDRSGHEFKRVASEFAMALILLPGAILGQAVKGYHKATKKELPAFVMRVMQAQKQKQTPSNSSASNGQSPGGR